MYIWSLLYTNYRLFLGGYDSKAARDIHGSQRRTRILRTTHMGLRFTQGISVMRFSGMGGEAVGSGFVDARS